MLAAISVWNLLPIVIGIGILYTIGLGIGIYMDDKSEEDVEKIKES